MSVFDLARQLGEELLKAPETEAVLAAKKAYEADEKAVKLIQDFKVFQEEYQQKLQKPDLTKEEYEKLTMDLRAKGEEINSYPQTSQLIQTEQVFNELLNRVFTVVTATIAGEDPSAANNCAGSCGSCSGCH